MDVLEVSFRRGFTSRLFPSSKPMLRIQGGAELVGDPAIEVLEHALAGMRVIVLIHGYNNTVDNARAAYDQILATISAWEYDVALLVYWTGHTGPGFWIANGAADDAGHKLARMLRWTTPARVDFQAHSLGNRVLMETLPGMTYMKVGVAVMAAPAIDDEALGSQYKEAAAVPGKVLICASRQDQVLGVWYRRLGSLLTNWATWGDSALGFNGPEGIVGANVTVLQAPDQPPVDHGDWKNYAPMYDAWKGLLPA